MTTTKKNVNDTTAAQLTTYNYSKILYVSTDVPNLSTVSNFNSDTFNVTATSSSSHNNFGLNLVIIVIFSIIILLAIGIFVFRKKFKQIFNKRGLFLNRLSANNGIYALHHIEEFDRNTQSEYNIDLDQINTVARQQTTYQNEYEQSSTLAIDRSLVTSLSRPNQTGFFNDSGGKLFCSDCEDFLFIPKNAIPSGKSYEITEYFSNVICAHETNTDVDYSLRFVKEYREIENRIFLTHVQIVCHCEISASSAIALTVENLRVRYGSAMHSTFLTAQYISDEVVKKNINLPDVFFTLNNEKIIIYTKHFTIFKYETRRLILGKCRKTKQVMLKTDIYAGRNKENNTLVLIVYVIDVATDNCREMRAINNQNEQEDGLKKVCIARNKVLSPLPSVISGKTKIDCHVSFNSKLWFSFDPLHPNDIPCINNQSEVDNTLPIAREAAEILNAQTHSQSPFGPFHLKSRGSVASLEAVVGISFQDDESENFITSKVDLNVSLNCIDNC